MIYRRRKVKRYKSHKRFRVKGFYNRSSFFSKTCSYKKKKKKKNHGKWRSYYTFLRRKSTNTVGHPIWVYKKKGRAYKHLTFTHTPVEGHEDDYDLLGYNIDPFDHEPCYVSKKFSIEDKDAFEATPKKYRIHHSDKEKVRQYQK